MLVKYFQNHKHFKEFFIAGCNDKNFVEEFLVNMLKLTLISSQKAGQQQHQVHCVQFTSNSHCTLETSKVLITVINQKCFCFSEMFQVLAFDLLGINSRIFHYEFFYAGVSYNISLLTDVRTCFNMSSDISKEGNLISHSFKY